MKQSSEQFAIYDCVKLENTSLALWATQDEEPRVIGLRLTGSGNLLAVIPNATTTTDLINRLAERIRDGLRQD